MDQDLQADIDMWARMSWAQVLVIICAVVVVCFFLSLLRPAARAWAACRHGMRKVRVEGLRLKARILGASSRV